MPCFLPMSPSPAMPKSTPALLALADGTVYHGRSIGAAGTSAGEVVFNTALTGYQEILSDPSYARQIVTLTYPHIGNVGTNGHDEEADRSWCAGLVVRDVPARLSNWRSGQSLTQYLEARGIVGIADIDTRALTRRLRTSGAQNGCLMAGRTDVDEALALARGFAGLKGMDLAREVTTAESYRWQAGSFDLDSNGPRPATARRFKVVAHDFGVKQNILRLLVDAGCEVEVVPAQTSADAVMARRPDGVFLSNGPGDPAPCDYAIAAIRQYLAERLPVFGICLGHQLLGLAAGAQTLKMKFGHHGANHPVLDLETQKVAITSQNHGFAIDESTLPANVRVTHRSLFDGSNQGIRLTDRPAFSFQGHPEASPGPHDIGHLFTRFTAMMAAYQSSPAA